MNSLMTFSVSISDDQALCVSAALQQLMKFEISIREGLVSQTTNPDDISVLIGLIIKAFSYTHPQLEDVFEKNNFRDIAFGKLQAIHQSVDKAN